MLIKELTGRGPASSKHAEEVYVSIYNSTGAALSAGYNVCFNVRNNASANGIDVEKPATSALPAYAGVVANPEQDTSYSIADTQYGLAQVYGFNSVCFLRVESTDASGAVEGTAFGPANAQWYLVSNGRSFEFGPVMIMSRIAAGTFEARAEVFIRAL